MGRGSDRMVRDITTLADSIGYNSCDRVDVYSNIQLAQEEMSTKEIRQQMRVLSEELDRIEKLERNTAIRLFTVKQIFQLLQLRKHIERRAA